MTRDWHPAPVAPFLVLVDTRRHQANTILWCLLSLWAACSVPPKDRCSADADCASGEICLDNFCANLEQGTPDGGSPEVDPDTGLFVCPEGESWVLYGHDEEGCVPRCTGDDDCLAGTSCRGDFCLPDDKFVALHIQFSTESDGTCDGDAPGPDLMWARLDSADTLLGWARVIESEIDTDSNQFTSTAHLDGLPPDDTGNCPTLSASNVVSLGCGWILLEFVDAQGRTLPISSGQVITIGEYGPECGEPGREEYEARLCTQRNPDSCDQFHIGGSGVIEREVF